MPYIENKAAQAKAAATTGAKASKQALTTGAQKTGDALLLAKKTAVNRVNMFLSTFSRIFVNQIIKFQ